MSKNGGNLTIQYNLRWSEELRDKIADEAKKNTRSMNQEIVARLEESLQETKYTEEDFKLKVRNFLSGIFYAGVVLGNEDIKELEKKYATSPSEDLRIDIEAKKVFVEQFELLSKKEWLSEYGK